MHILAFYNEFNKLDRNRFNYSKYNLSASLENIFKSWYFRMNIWSWDILLSYVKCFQLTINWAWYTIKYNLSKVKHDLI